MDIVERYAELSFQLEHAEDNKDQQALDDIEEEMDEIFYLMSEEQLKRLIKDYPKLKH